MGILKQAESSVQVTELCREHGMSNALFYKWRAKFGGMDASMISELKSMAEENRRLKRMGIHIQYIQPHSQACKYALPCNGQAAAKRLHRVIQSQPA